MSLTIIAAMAGIGALGALLGSVLALPLRNRNRGAYSAVVAVLTIVAITAGQQLVVPELKLRQARAEATAELKKNPVFSLLIARHPEVESGFIAIVEESVKKGETAEQAKQRGIVWGHSTIGKFLPQYLPLASDAALIGFTTKTVELLDRVAAKSTDACWVSLFGTAEQQHALADELMPPDLLPVMMSAMEGVLRSAIESPAAADPNANPDQLLELLVTGLVEKQGPELAQTLQALANPTAPGVDKAALCHASRAMFREALGMPAPQNALVLRAMYAQQ